MDTVLLLAAAALGILGIATAISAGVEYYRRHYKIHRAYKILRRTQSGELVSYAATGELCLRYPRPVDDGSDLPVGPWVTAPVGGLFTYPLSVVFDTTGLDPDTELWLVEGRGIVPSPEVICLPWYLSPVRAELAWEPRAREHERASVLVHSGIYGWGDSRALCFRQVRLLARVGTGCAREGSVVYYFA
jgi:hypothetical protein